MVAIVLFDPNWDASAILSLAGAPEQWPLFDGRHLHVHGVSQAALDAAMSSYDHNQAMVKPRLVANNAAYEVATKALTSDYPQLEKDTWPTQNEQASAWVADHANASTPWIDRAAAERGIDREEYLRRTLVKAEQFKILSAFLTGRRQKYEDQIKAGGDPALVYALTPEIQAELEQVAETVMTTPSSDMQAALA